MKTANSLQRKRQSFRSRMNQVKRLAIPANLFLITILHDAIAEDNRADPITIHLNAFNAVGRHGTFHHRILPKPSKLLGRLPRIQFLMSALFGNRLQLPTDIQRQSVKFR